MKKIITLILALLPIAASAQKSSFIVDLNGAFHLTNSAIAGGGVSLIWEVPVSNFYLGAGVGLASRAGSETNNGKRDYHSVEVLVPAFVHAAYDLSEKFKLAVDVGCAYETDIFTLGGRSERFIPYAEPQVLYNAGKGFRLGLGYQLGYDELGVRESKTTANGVLDSFRKTHILSNALTIHLSKAF